MHRHRVLQPTSIIIGRVPSPCTSLRILSATSFPTPGSLILPKSSIFEEDKIEIITVTAVVKRVIEGCGSSLERIRQMGKEHGMISTWIGRVGDRNVLVTRTHPKRRCDLLLKAHFRQVCAHSPILSFQFDSEWRLVVGGQSGKMSISEQSIVDNTVTH